MSEELTRALKETSERVNATLAGILLEKTEPKTLYDASRHLIEAGGKRLRPFLVIESCEIVGGNMESALSVAAAAEILHNFTLIHDDIMDADTKRRGAPTTHVVWGVPIAIIAGDLLFAEVYRTVLENGRKTGLPVPVTLEILSRLTNASIEICRGQALDMLFESRESVSEEEYISMISGKTAALLKASAESGALAGGGKPELVSRLGRFAYYSGIAFQLVDDVLGLTADEKVLGKPVGSDIREGKRTLIIAHFMDNSSREQRMELLSILGNKDATAQDVQRAKELLSSKGSIKYAEECAARYTGKAKAELSIFPETRSKRLLLELSDYIVQRSY